jgi:hypothetical protein
VWSDVFFLPLTLVFLLLLERINDRPRDPDLVIALAALVAGLAFLMRYAAVPLFAVGVIVVVVTFAREGLRTVALRLTTFALVAAVLPGLWVLRNAATEGGRRIADRESLVQLIGDSVVAVARMFVPLRGNQTLSIALGLLIVLVLLGAATVIHFRRPIAAALRSADGFALIPLLTLVAVYIPFVIAARRLVGSNIDERITLPAFVPLIVLGAWVLDQLVNLAPPLLVRALAVVATAWIATLAVAFVDDAIDDGGAGLGYAAVTDDSIFVAADGVNDDSLIVSNEPFLLAIETGHQPILRSPGPLVPGLSHFPVSIEELTSRVACSNTATYLAWFGSPKGEDDLDSPSQLREDFDLEVVERASDGTLYRITVPEGAQPACGA